MSPRRLASAMLALIALMGPIGAAQPQSIDDRARAAAAASRAKSVDSDALLKNYVTPGISGQPISTIDGSKSLTSTLACQKSATLLELLIQPSATGDIGTLRISRDTDLDGTPDSVATLPIPISGICANGVISCQPGSWNQCHYLRWEIDSASAVKLAEVDMPQLAGCYCVNNSCGQNLVFANLPSVLGDLGGGIVGALTTADPHIGVAQALIDGPVIRYVGAQATACAASPSVTQTAYRASPAALQGDAAAASSMNTVFQMLKASPAGQGTASTPQSCTIERVVTVDAATPEQVIDRSAGGYATVAAVANERDFLMGSPADKSLKGGKCSLFDYHMTLAVGEPDRIMSARLTHLYADDWAQLFVDGEPVASGPASWTGDGLPPGKCEQKKAFHIYPDLDLKPWLTKGTHEIRLRVAVADEGEAMAQIRVVLDTACRSSESLRDLCAGPAAAPHCRLVDETVDGVTTLIGGIRTGLTPLPQTRILGDTACPVTLARDFFERDRRYRCEMTAGTQAPPDLSRAAYIIDHSTETLLADRQRSADGTVTESTRPFTLPAQPATATCEPVCKTKRAVANAAAAPAGVMASQQNDPIGWETSYRACSAGNVCRADPGDEIVTPCGCIDDFPEAVALMQTVRLAGADLVCTQAQR